MANDEITEFTARYKAEITNATGSPGWLVWDFDFNAPASDNGVPVYRITRYECEKWILAHEGDA